MHHEESKEKEALVNLYSNFGLQRRKKLREDEKEGIKAAKKLYIKERIARLIFIADSLVSTTY